MLQPANVILMPIVLEWDVQQAHMMLDGQVSTYFWPYCVVV